MGLKYYEQWPIGVKILTFLKSQCTSYNTSCHNTVTFSDIHFFGQYDTVNGCLIGFDASMRLMRMDMVLLKVL